MRVQFTEYSTVQYSVHSYLVTHDANSAVSGTVVNGLPLDITCLVVMLRNQADIVRDYLAAEGARSEECSSPMLEPPPLASHSRLSQKRGSLTTGLLSHAAGGGGNNNNSNSSSSGYQGAPGAPVKQTSPHRNSFCGSQTATRSRLPNKPQLSAAGVVHSSAAASGSSGAGASGFNSFSSSSSSTSATANIPYLRGRSSSQPQEVIEQTISKMSKVSIVRRSVSTKSGNAPSQAPASKTSSGAAKSTSSKSNKARKTSPERKLSQ